MPRLPTPRLDQRAIRRASLSAVLGEIAEHGPGSRATLATRTGLNKTTVSSLVAELIAYDLVAGTDEDERAGRVGRPAQTVRLNGEAIAAIGIEVNVDYDAICIVDLAGDVRYERRVEADNAGTGPAAALDRIGQLTADAIARTEAAGVRVVGATMAVPGLVEPGGQRLVFAPNLGWSDLRCGDELRLRLGRPALRVSIENEANLAVLAEHSGGAARGRADVVCVTGSVGIGGGLLVRGALLRGHHGFAGELGHVVVDPGGAACPCGGRGCLETVAGKEAVARRAGVPVHATDLLVERARAGDPATRAALDAAGRALGVALASTVEVLDPELLVLGGYLTPLTEWLEAPLRAELDARTRRSGIAPYEIARAHLGEHAAVRGAAASVLGAVMTDPTLVGEPRAPAPAAAPTTDR